MKIHHLPNAVRQDYYTVRVTFKSGSGQYTFKVHDSIALEMGDQVVVQTKYGSSVADVLFVDDIPQINYDAPFEYSWVVQKVDRTQYDKLTEQDRKIIDEGKKREHKMNQQRALEFFSKSVGDSFLNKLDEILKIN